MICAAFSYTATPKGYACSACGATNCKLWRQYQTFADNIELKCANCSGADVSTLDDDGNVESDLYGPKGQPVHDLSGQFVGLLGSEECPMPRTDQLGGLMPAVPTEEGDTFWGYTSVPAAGCRWWRALPSKPEVKA